jgi:antitoxin component of RelBE/YafQ-DinJ toxin-antitoxin module
MANGKSNVNVKIDTTVKETATMLLDRMGIDKDKHPEIYDWVMNG